MGDSVHAEGEFLAWVLQQLTPLGEGLGDHFALLDAFGLIITLPSQPESRRGGGGEVEEQLLPTKSSERAVKPFLPGKRPPEGPKSLEDSEE